MNKSAASAASPDYVKFQAVIKSAASAASSRGGRASGRLDHDYFVFAFVGRASGQKIIKISDSVLGAGRMVAQVVWILQYSNNIPSRIAYRYTCIFDAG